MQASSRACQRVLLPGITATIAVRTSNAPLPASNDVTQQWRRCCSASPSALAGASHATLTTSRRCFMAGTGVRRPSSASDTNTTGPMAPGEADDTATFSFLDLDVEHDETAATNMNQEGVESDQTSTADRDPHREHPISASDERSDRHGSHDNGDAPPLPPPSSPPVQLATVRLHNLPKNWMHEEIIEFIHAVAVHAGIPEPLPLDQRHSNGRSRNAEGEDESSAIPKATSPYVHRLTIPFGRRTGLIYGEPTVVVTPRDLANYLVKDLSFDPDDYRSRIHFTWVQKRSSEGANEGEGTESDEHVGAGSSITSFEEIEESAEAEQAEALRTLELDRYLMAPDLLLDIAKMHQRRLVTANEKVLLDSFLDGEEDDVSEDDAAIAAAAGRGEAVHHERADEAMETDFDGGGGTSSASSKAKKTVKKKTSQGTRRKPGASQKRNASRRAGDLTSPGRGSMHNMPIPKPYVQGRSL